MEAYTSDRAEKLRDSFAHHAPSVKFELKGDKVIFRIRKDEYNRAIRGETMQIILQNTKPEGYKSLGKRWTQFEYTPKYDASTDEFMLVYNRLFYLEDYLECSERLDIPLLEEWVDIIFEKFNELSRARMTYTFIPKRFTFDGKELKLVRSNDTVSKKELDEILKRILRGATKEVRDRFYEALNYGFACFEKYHFLKVLGGGFTAIIYQVCDKDNCDYVMKIVTKQEAKIAKMAADLKIAPKIYDEIECKTSDIYIGEDSVAIVMDKFDGDLTKIFDVIETSSIQDKINLCKVIAKRIIDILIIMKDANIFHGDTKINNFLFKFNPNLCICIADFGISRIEQYKSIDSGLSFLMKSIVNKDMAFSFSSLRPEDSFYLLRELCESGKKNGVDDIFCDRLESKSEAEIIAYIKAVRK